jgi:hypothetical protein
MVPHPKAFATSVMNHHNMKSINGFQSKLWLLAFGPTQPVAAHRDKIEKAISMEMNTQNKVWAASWP